MAELHKTKQPTTWLFCSSTSWVWFDSSILVVLGILFLNFGCNLQKKGLFKKVASLQTLKILEPQTKDDKSFVVQVAAIVISLASVKIPLQSYPSIWALAINIIQLKLSSRDYTSVIVIKIIRLSPAF